MSLSESMALMKAAETLAYKGYCIRSADSVCDKDFENVGVCAKCIRNFLRREARKTLRKEVRKKRKKENAP